MPIDVRLSDGRVVTVDTDDPQKAARAVQRMREREAQRQTPAYQEARRREEQRRPEHNPTPVIGGVADFVDQMQHNMGIRDEMRGGIAYAGQAIENLVRPRSIRDLVAGRPRISPDDAYRAAADVSNERGERYAQEHPVRNIGSIAASIPAFGGSPVVGSGRVGMLRAGGAAAATNAPFALARQEGSLQERLPGALRETAVVGGVGVGLQGVANALSPQIRPQAARRAAHFERAGVRPTLAAIGGTGQRGLTKLIAENFIAGGRTRAALQNSIDDTANAARRIANQVGQVGPREVVGESVQSGVRRFNGSRNMPQPRPGDPRSIPVRDWSFGAKSEALYSRVFDNLARDEAAMVGQVDGPLISVDATQRALQSILGRVQGPASAEVIQSPLIQRIANAIETDAGAGALRFQDLRAWRTWVREARGDQALRQGVTPGQLSRLEGALSEDIYRSAELIGGDSARQLQLIDRWYRTISNRIQTALQPFDDAPGGAQAYKRIIDLASRGGRENSRQLATLANYLKPDEMRSVAATLIDELGSPTFGNPHIHEPGAFSVDRFSNNYARLSSEGRRILFGPAAAELDNLARVAGYQKQIEAMANHSRSGINMQNAGSFMGLANPSTMAPTAGMLSLGALTGEMLTNPAFVRWMVSAQRGGGVGGMRRQLAALAQLAARDPALAPYYDALARRVGEKLQPRSEPRTTRREPLPQ